MFLDLWGYIWQILAKVGGLAGKDIVVLVANLRREVGGHWDGLMGVGSNLFF